MLIKLQESLIFVTLFSEIFCFDYCAMKICPNQHTLCLYPTDKVACEGDGTKAGLTEDLRQTILDLHNNHRKTVALGKESPQPKASNMMKLIWNEEAETIAQHWANQCYYSHDTCRVLQNGLSVGQNIAQSSVSMTSPNIKKSIEEFIDLWYSEVKVFDKAGVSKFKFSGKVGHYTQIAWAETTAIGCGFIEYKSGNPHFKNAYLVCNYVPAGNFGDQPVYKIGKACSACPEGAGCSKQYPGLCTMDKDDFGGVPDDSKGSPTCLKPSHLSLVFYLLSLTLAVNLLTIMHVRIV